jgi:hypothetical protein
MLEDVKVALTEHSKGSYFILKRPVTEDSVRSVIGNLGIAERKSKWVTAQKVRKKGFGDFGSSWSACASVRKLN